MSRPSRRRIALIATLLGVLLSIQWTAAKGAPWSPTRQSRVRRMLAMVGLRPEQTLYDLGSGDGRVLFTAARRFGARAVGIELDPLRYAWTRLAIALLGLRGRVEVRRDDIFRSDLSEADVVTCYLWQHTNDALEAKLADELRPGTRVASHRYRFNSLRLVDEDPRALVYVYEV